MQTQMATAAVSRYQWQHELNSQGQRDNEFRELKGKGKWLKQALWGPVSVKQPFN